MGIAIPVGITHSTHALNKVGMEGKREDMGKVCHPVPSRPITILKNMFR